MPYLIGIDIGTSSAKAVLIDESGEVKSTVAPEYDFSTPKPLWAESDPDDWWQATIQAIKHLLEEQNIDPADIAGLGLTGQMHGLVLLDKQGKVLRPCIMWNDQRSASQCDSITKKIGSAKVLELTGNPVLAGFTAPKIAWLKKHEPKNYKRLATVLLPHDYLNFWLTGNAVMEYGDASGTALLDVKNRKWSAAAIKAVDPALADKLPPLISSDQPVGHLSVATAKSLGLSTDTLVSAGGGDNMMGAIGTGNTRPGIVTASFGTSGTIYACAAKPVIDPQGEIAAFCDSTNHWLPLLCTMNVTVATEMVRSHYGLSHAQFEKAAAKIRAGSDGLILLPYLEGERTPNVPDGTGVWFGANTKTQSTGHFARAAMEGVTLGMNYGLLRLAALGVKPKQIRATGGGAQSKLWRQIMADIFNTEVVTLAVSEGAAYGAALQAMWCAAQNSGEKVQINDLSDQFVKLNSRQTAQPKKENVAVYRQLQAIQGELSTGLRAAFSCHRRFSDCE